MTKSFLHLQNICVYTVRVWFEPTSYTVNEDAGVVLITVMTNIPGGPPAGTVTFNTVDGTAKGM